MTQHTKRDVTGQIANWGSIITTNWVAVVGLLGSAAFGVLQYLYNFVSDPRFQAAVLVFLTSFWVMIGFCYLRDRRRGFPVKRSTQGPGDLAWALSASGVYWSFNRQHEQHCYQLGINFQNASGVALKFDIEHLEVRIGTRSIKLDKSVATSGVVPFSIAKTYRLNPFPKKEVADFIDTPSEGSMEATIKYGRHDGPYERRLKVEYKLYLMIAEPMAGGGVADTIVSETDEPI